MRPQGDKATLGPRRRQEPRNAAKVGQDADAGLPRTQHERPRCSLLVCARRKPATACVPSIIRSPHVDSSSRQGVIRFCAPPWPGGPPHARHAGRGISTQRHRTPCACPAKVGFVAAVTRWPRLSPQHPTSTVGAQLPGGRNARIGVGIELTILEKTRPQRYPAHLVSRSTPSTCEGNRERERFALQALGSGAKLVRGREPRDQPPAHDDRHRLIA